MIGNARPAAEARSINFRRETVPVNNSSKSSLINLLLMSEATVCQISFSLACGLDAGLLQFGDEHFPDFRVFVFVFDQVAAFARSRLAQAMRLSATAPRTPEPIGIA